MSPSQNKLNHMQDHTDALVTILEIYIKDILQDLPKNRICSIASNDIQIWNRIRKKLLNSLTNVIDFFFQFVLKGS